MKKTYYIFLFLFLFGGCKKELANRDACLGVVCLNGGVCVNGACVCNLLWTGSDCSHLIIPLDSFTGDYHMVGNTTVYNSGLPPVITDIDHTLSITKVNDSTLLFNGFQLQYSSTQPDSFYRYFSDISYRTISLQFHKPFIDDSAFYNLNESSPFGTGATLINMSGVKIH